MLNEISMYTMATTSFVESNDQPDAGTCNQMAEDRFHSGLQAPCILP